MPELHDIAVRAIELANNRIQAGFGVAVAGWKLSRTAHPLAQDVGDNEKSRIRVLVPLNRFTWVMSSHTFIVYTNFLSPG